MNFREYRKKRRTDKTEKLKLFKVTARGIGLLQALIFTKPETARKFFREARGKGLLVVQGEVTANSVVFRPSLTINFNDVLEIESRVRKVLDKVL